MAARLIWSNEALNDVSAIAEYISRDSPYHARRVTQEFFTIAEAVVEQPKLGRVVPELNDEHVRERFLYSYRLNLRDTRRQAAYPCRDSWATFIGNV